MTEPTMPGHPVGPEIDDSQNPTAASPSEGSRVPANMKDMLVQLQAMIDSVAVQAGPVLREVAAKAAELAAVAGERAGPLAYKAAEKTQVVGQRVADKSKEVAADLRRQLASADENAEAADSESTASDEFRERETEPADSTAGKGWSEG